MPRLPIQPTLTDAAGTVRFRENKIVRYLLDNGGLDLNDLADKVHCDREDWEQFAQLIGYSLSGFSSLSYVSDETYEAAQAMSQLGMSEQEARIQHLESVLAVVRENAKAMAVHLFRIHPDDLHI